MSKLDNFCRFLRASVLFSTTQAGSGHLTSCLSAVELVAVLFYHFFRFDITKKDDLANDRLIFSKGHAAPLLYALWAAVGVVDKKELFTLRDIKSNLEGHPTFRFPWAQVATGSLGQGLGNSAGIAAGILLALGQKKVGRKPKVYVLMGDSELAEGSVWEAFQWIGYQKINNIVAIIDQNRLGQSRETMWDWNPNELKKRVESFGWKAIILEDGHDVDEIYQAFLQAEFEKKPVIIIAKTIKGKGISFLENKMGWHGKALPSDLFEKAKEEVGDVDLSFHISLKKPKYTLERPQKIILSKPMKIELNTSEKVFSMREYFGKFLVELSKKKAHDLVVFDAEVSNSTFTSEFEKTESKRFFEMFIAEQNMLSVATGIQSLGYKPFVATFSAFLTRAYDQIRMAQYSKANLVLVGTHAGSAIGPDGPSQMGLEDIAMMRSILNSVVFSPADVVSAIKLLELSYSLKGIVYLRLLRNKTKKLYDWDEIFELGGFKILVQDKKPEVVFLTTGITVHQALDAAEKLKKMGVKICVVDVYSIKPINYAGIQKLISGSIAIVVEDHFPAGGLFEAVVGGIKKERIYRIGVDVIPHSGKEEDSLHYVGLSSDKIVDKTLKILNQE